MKKQKGKKEKKKERLVDFRTRLKELLKDGKSQRHAIDLIIEERLNEKKKK